MNTNIRPHGRAKLPLICNVMFEAHLPPDLYGKLTSEIIKYVLFFRGQIPQQVEQLKRSCQVLSKELEDVRNPDSDSQGIASSNKLRITQGQAKKQEMFLSKLDKLLMDLEKLFQEIQHVTSQILNFIGIRFAIVLGSTIYSPKDVFLIEIPKICNSNVAQPSRRHMAHLLRSLVTSEDLSKLPSTGLTNVHVLVELPKSRSHLTQWFVPKPNFSLLNRGQHVVIQFGVQTENPKDTAAFVRAEQPPSQSVLVPEIPEDHSLSLKERRNGKDPDKDTCSDGEEDEVASGTLGDLQLEDYQNEEMMWFQAPVVIKGLKDIISPNASDNWF